MHLFMHYFLQVNVKQLVVTGSTPGLALFWELVIHNVPQYTGHNHGHWLSANVVVEFKHWIILSSSLKLFELVFVSAQEFDESFGN